MESIRSILLWERHFWVCTGLDNKEVNFSEGTHSSYTTVCIHTCRLHCSWDCCKFYLVQGVAVQTKLKERRKKWYPSADFQGMQAALTLNIGATKSSLLPLSSSGFVPDKTKLNKYMYIHAHTNALETIVKDFSGKWLQYKDETLNSFYDLCFLQTLLKNLFKYNTDFVTHFLVTKITHSVRIFLWQNIYRSYIECRIRLLDKFNR